MATSYYESLVASTKKALCSGYSKEFWNAAYFNTLLENCGSCINQSFQLISELISEAEVCIEKLTEYLTTAVSLVHMLTDFSKTIVESLAMMCSEMKTFPTATGMIILNVFTHCKNSEILYGINLCNVQKVLKDLFTNCQELQLTYFMILEKHFVLDLTEPEQKEILLEALNINFRIGEIVNALDAKTIAVHWKSFTRICERYSVFLHDTSIFEDCLVALCMLIRNNIIKASEVEDGMVARKPGKLANFFLKIMTKICSIFKQATRKDYNSVISLLYYIHEKRFVCLEMTSERVQFINFIADASECLLKELLCDEVFVNNLLNCDINKLKQDGAFLGFLLTLTFVMQCLMQGIRSTATKCMLINCLYSVLPLCNFWDFDLRLSSDPALKPHGLFEHLIIHTTSLAFTLTVDEYSILERNMIEAVLGTDCASALFSANLWALLFMARSFRNINPQLLFNQIVWLCTMYKKLEKQSMFNRSHQKLHLSYTIGRLFYLMNNDEKTKICKQFRIHDDDNLSLWAALGVKSLPDEAKNAAEEVVAEKLKTQFQCLDKISEPEDIVKLTKAMTLAATCAFKNTRGIDDYIIKAWSKTCLKNQFVIQEVDAGTVWFHDFLRALVALTDSLWNKICTKNVYLVKILHHVTGLIKQCSVEFKLLFVNILCKIAASEIIESKIVNENFSEAFTRLSQNSEEILRNKLFMTLKKYRQDENVDRILSAMEDCSLRESWSKIKDGQDCCHFGDVKDTGFKYESKNVFETCSSSVVSELNKAMSGNFDFCDNVDSLLENECDIKESACKRMKLDNKEVETTLRRLENDSAFLGTLKENIITADYKRRVRSICDKLKNTIN